MEKGDRQATERQCESITSIAGAINTLKETLEEKKFSKGESDEQVTEWREAYEQELATVLILAIGNNIGSTHQPNASPRERRQSGP